MILINENFPNKKFFKENYRATLIQRKLSPYNNSKRPDITIKE